MQTNRISFIDRKVSRNAVFTTALGGILLGAHVLMILFSITKKGTLPVLGGVIESYLFLFSFFGLLWAILHYDEEKTNERFKVMGILLNAAALAFGIFIMAVGFFSY